MELVTMVFRIPLALELMGLAATYWVYSVSMVVFFESWGEVLLALTAVG